MALDVVVRMTAQEAGAYRAWAEQQRAVNQTAEAMKSLTGASAAASLKGNDLERALGQIASSAGRVAADGGRAGKSMDQLGASTGDATKELKQYFSGQAARWVSMAGGIGVAVQGFRQLISIQKELKQEEARTTFDLDSTFRNLAVQAQVSEAEMPAMQRRVFEVAKSEAMPTEEVAAAAKQLISSSFSKEQVFSGGILKEFVQGVQGMAGGGENFDITEGSKALAQYMKGMYGVEGLTRENTRKEMQELGTLFLSKDIQLEDLTYLARPAEQAKNAGIDSTTFKAAYTRLRDSFNAEMSGTALRSIIASLQTAKVTDSKTEGLAMLGLTPAEVDLQGEDFVTVFARLNRGLARVDKTTGASAFKKLFETESMNQALTLAKNYQDIPRYAAQSQDARAYREAIEMKTSGYDATLNKYEVEKQEARFLGEGAKIELIARKLEAMIPGASGKATRKAFEELAPVVGIRNALANAALPEPALAGHILREVERDLTHRDLPRGKEITAIAPDVAVKRFEDDFSRSEASAEVERGRRIDAEKQAAEKKLLDERFEKSHDAYRLVLSSLADAKAAKGASPALVSAEASAAETAFQTGEISSLSPAQVQRFNQAAVSRFGNRDLSAMSGREMGEFERRLIDLLIQVAANTAEPTVKIKNPGDPERRARRGKAVSPPTASLGR